MIQLRTLITEAAAVFSNLFQQPDWRNIVDIGILTILIYQAIKICMNTRAISLFKGILALLFLWWVSDILQITALRWLLQQVMGTGALLLIILFQPELRRALDQLGRRKWMHLLPNSHNRQVNTSASKHVNEIIAAAMNMSRKRIGALIVFEQQTALGDVTDSGTIVDAEITAPLIENIFEPNTPLHDGAMMIRDERINAAACILQLSDDYSISRDLGTRHRAGLGITESTDAISLIVSEETGIISVAKGGKLTRYMDEEELRKILLPIFDPEAATHKSRFTRKREGKESDEQ